MRDFTHNYSTSKIYLQKNDPNIQQTEKCPVPPGLNIDHNYRNLMNLTHNNLKVNLNPSVHKHMYLTEV